MTVQTNTNVASFNGNGVTQIFPIGFKFNSDTDLIVLLADNLSGATSLLALNSDYTASGEGDDEGGLINVVVAPKTGQQLIVSRVVDILQLTDLRNQGKFFAEVHEDAFDRLTMIAQQLQTQIANSLALDAAGMTWDAKGRRIKALGEPVLQTDAATKGYADGAVAAEAVARSAADANLQSQISGGAPLEASAFSPISWHDQVIENSVTIPANKNAWSFGPTMTIAPGQTVTVSDGSFYTIANGEVNA